MAGEGVTHEIGKCSSREGTSDGLASIMCTSRALSMRQIGKEPGATHRSAQSYRHTDISLSAQGLRVVFAPVGLLLVCVEGAQHCTQGRDCCSDVDWDLVVQTPDMNTL